MVCQPHDQRGRGFSPPAHQRSRARLCAGSPERAALQAELARQSTEVLEVPAIIGGQRVTTGRLIDVVMHIAIAT